MNFYLKFILLIFSWYILLESLPEFTNVTVFNDTQYYVTQAQYSAQHKQQKIEHNEFHAQVNTCAIPLR